MVDSAAEARLRAEARAKTAAMKADADPLAALQKSIAESKAQVEKKNIEIPTIALEQAVNTGDKNAIVDAAKAVAKAQGGSATTQASNAIEAVQNASPKPTLSPANIARGDTVKWVGGVSGSWQIIKGTKTTTTTTTTTNNGNGGVVGGGKKETRREVLGAGATRVIRVYYDDGSFQDFPSPDTSGNGGDGGTGGLTQSDLDIALAKQKAEFEALMAKQAADAKAAADAAKQATRMKAKDKLTAMLAGWKLEGLASWLDKQIMGDVSEEMILLGLYDQPEYQKRFPGMEALRKAGRTVTEAEYIDIENRMIQTARFFDLPKGFYDGPEDFGNLIGKQVSAKEYQDRLQVGQDLARSLNPSVKQQLIDFYGVGEGDLTAYVLDADRALPLIQKQAKAAMFVGLGRAAGFSIGGITAQQAESIAGTESYAKLSEAQLKQALEGAGQLRRTQQRLSQIEGMTYNEQEALSAVIESSPEALLASQQRAQREVARFGARGGITAGSLRGTETAI